MNDKTDLNGDFYCGSRKIERKSVRLFAFNGAFPSRSAADDCIPLRLAMFPKFSTLYCAIFLSSASRIPRKLLPLSRIPISQILFDDFVTIRRELFIVATRTANWIHNSLRWIKKFVLTKINFPGKASLAAEKLFANPNNRRSTPTISLGKVE